MRSAAIDVAKISKCRYRMGAVLKNGKDTVSATNIMKTHPWLNLDKSKPRVSIHAEMRVLIKAKQKAKGSTIWVARVNKAGDPVCSKPCPLCVHLMKEAKVSHVHYLNEYGLWEVAEL